MIKEKITFIGPGKMAEAMIAGLLRENVCKPEQISASGPRQERVEQLQQSYGLTPFTNNLEAAKQADIVVFSIKPQRLDKVMEDLKDQLKPETLIISIIAGATIKKIIKGTGIKNAVRSMPNTPGSIGMGITVWAQSKSVSEAQHSLATQVLTALGKEVFVDEEEFLDKATALSGTGPAYVFLFMEAMIDAGVHLGFSRRIAEELVTETMRGSVAYYTHPDTFSHVTRLRNHVTSPGGTTAEAMYYLEKAGFRTAVSRAIWAAYKKSISLGKDPKADPPD